MRIEETPVIAAVGPHSVDTPDYGTVTLAASLYERWNTDGKGTVGWPVADSFTLAGGGNAVYCERGMIVDPPRGATFIVQGRIYVKYRALGDVTGWVGLPTSDEQAAPGNGRVSHFQNADIYWRSDTGAYEVHGAIRDQFQAQGGTGGFLGYPLTDESPVLQGASEIGRFNRFQGGVIYWSGPTGAFEVHGAIRDRWENTHKGATGDLGLPLSNELRTPTDSYRYSNFEHGVIVFRTSDGALFTLTQLELYLARFDSKGDDGFLRGSQDVYVHVDVTASSGEGYHQRMPSSGDYGSDENIEQVIMTIGRMQGETSVHVKMDGWDSDWPDSDDRLGTVDQNYTIENLWGLDEDATHWVGDFMASYKFRQIVNYDPTKFRENLYWHFHNFDTAELSWQQYAATFSDVSNDESVVWHPFDHAYYSLVYKGVASSGNCFGMCWESIFAQVGRSIYREPIALVAPTNGSRPDPNTNHEVINEVNVKHGYQVSGEMIDWFLGKFVLGQTHDPVRAFNESQAQFAQGDYPVLALTSKSLSVAGHVVRPYRWDDLGNTLRIYIADPNNPLTAATDDLSSFIDIDKASNTFTYQHGANDVWTGGTWSGGRMYSIPFHVVCHQPRTPFWEVLGLLVAGTVIILGGDADTVQIRDSNGKTYYDPNLTAPPTLHEQTAKDEQRIPNMARIHLTDDVSAFRRLVTNPGRLFVTQKKAPEVYYMAHTQSKLHLGTEHTRETLGSREVIASLGTEVTPSPSQPTNTEHLHFERPGGNLSAASRFAEIAAVHPGSPLPTGALEHTVQQGSGAYTWGVRSALGGTVVEAPCIQGTADRIVVENVGTAQQALTLDPEGAKTVAIHVAGRSDVPTRERSFTVSEMALKAGQKIRTMIDDESGALVIENPGDATQMNVEIRSGGLNTQPAVRTAVPLDAASVTRIAPTAWSPATMATVKVKLEKLDRIGGAPVSTSEI